MVYCVIITRDGTVEQVGTYKDYFQAESFANNIIYQIKKERNINEEGFPEYRKGESFFIDNLRIGVYTSTMVG